MLDSKPILSAVVRILTGTLSPAEVSILIGSLCAEAYLLGAQDVLDRMTLPDPAAAEAAAIAKAKA